MARKNSVSMAKKKIIPPDGGWGWIIVVAYAANNVIMIPILQGFSLVLKDAFKNLNIAATDASIIISVNSAFGMAVGLLHGPLLRNFGYRKIGLIGSIIFTVGITGTAFATTFTHFMVTYGLMASFGVGLNMSAFSLAVNAYFVQKRGRAIGMAMTFTGLGPIVMPQLVSYLLSSYGAKGTIVIIGGITLHCLAATLLLQPIKWHATWQPIESENEQSNTLKAGKIADSVKITNENVTIETEVKSKNENSSTNGDETEEKNNDECKGSKTNFDQADPSEAGDKVLPYKWWSSGKSFETVNLGSSEMIFDENAHFGHLVIDDTQSHGKSVGSTTSVKSLKNVALEAEEKLLAKEVSDTIPGVPDKLSDKDEQQPKSRFKRGLRRIVRFFDFDLLRDPIFVNMMLGMSIALFAEINFGFLTPFILADMDFTISRTATIMSTIAGIDLLSRGCAPFIGEWLRLPSRTMALISLFLLICCRTMLIFSRSYAAVIVVAVGLGLARGVRSVNMTLVIPNYIPIERLASATGIQMVVNGTVLMILGPLLGLARDKFGSYVPSLIIINSTTALTIIMWTTEMLIVRRRTRRREKKLQYEQVDGRKN